MKTWLSKFAASKCVNLYRYTPGVELEMGDAASAEPAAVAFPAGAAVIASVAAGMKESAVVDSAGKVFLWGSGSGNMQVGLHSLPGVRHCSHMDHPSCHQLNRVLTAK